MNAPLATALPGTRNDVITLPTGEPVLVCWNPHTGELQDIFAGMEAWDVVGVSDGEVLISQADNLYHVDTAAISMSEMIRRIAARGGTGEVVDTVRYAFGEEAFEDEDRELVD